jgi:hypothetical protein
MGNACFQQVQKGDSKLKPNQKACVTPRSLAPPPLGAAWKKLRCLHHTTVQPLRCRSTCDSRRAVGEVPRYRRPDLEADHAHHRWARDHTPMRREDANHCAIRWRAGKARSSHCLRLQLGRRRRTPNVGNILGDAADCQARGCAVLRGCSRNRE